MPPPTERYGLEAVSPDGLLQVSNDNPQVSVPALLCARDINFVQVELQGTAPEGAVLGSVYFYRADSPANERQRINFRWKADGTKRLITVAVAGQPEWRGIITRIRVDPINSRVAENIGARVRIGRLRVLGRL